MTDTPEKQAFRDLLAPLFATIAAAPIDKALEERLTVQFPPEGDFFQRVAAACDRAIAQGWMCAEGGEGRRFGRVIEPAEATHNLSVDVVEIADRMGPHHRHPTGEICLVMPVTPGATFDGHGAGWCVYPPGSAHFPTVRGGTARILYLLPGGEIDFTGREPPTGE